MPDQDIQSAIINILDDATHDREEAEQAFIASLNILEDFAERERHVENMQSAIINILDDAMDGRKEAEQSFVASLNILEDLRESEESISDMNTVLEARVLERTTELSALNSELESFAYSVAHDLRSPLRALSGFSEALADDYGGVLDAAGADYLFRIRRAAVHMAELIDGLLSLSRAARGTLVLEPVNLSGLVSGIANDLKRRLSGRRVTFVVQPGVIAVADRSLMSVVFQNILENSWKFTSGHDPSVIEFSHRSGVFMIRDNGIGFDPEFSHKLFMPFERLHGQEFAGTGIGLATVKRIIGRHNGKIWAEGEPGKGATFYFTLPDGRLLCRMR